MHDFKNVWETTQTAEFSLGVKISWQSVTSYEGQ